jgi:hypothetical protein
VPSNGCTRVQDVCFVGLLPLLERRWNSFGAGARHIAFVAAIPVVTHCYSEFFGGRPPECSPPDMTSQTLAPD